LKTTGKELDREKAEKWVDQYFYYLRWHANNLKDKRIKFMVKNLEDLRNNNWESRRKDTKVMTKAEVKDEYLKVISNKNAASGRRDRGLQTARRRGTTQNRNRASVRNRISGSTRRVATQHHNSGKTWNTVVGSNSNSQDVRSQHNKRGPPLNNKVTSSNSRTESPRTRVRTQNFGYNKSQNETHLPEKPLVAKDARELWHIVQDTISNPISNEELSEPCRLRNEAVETICRSPVKPVDFIQECVSKCFDSNNKNQCNELAKLFMTLGDRRYFDAVTFWQAIRQYVITFENNIVDCPNMALFTVELLNRCIKNKEIVMEYILNILEIMKNPEDEHSWDLPRFLGRALVQFMDLPMLEERKALISELDKRDLKEFFTFKPNKNDPPNKEGYFNATRFLHGNEKWLEIAGF